jgi:hypothetical protein
MEKVELGNPIHNLIYLYLSLSTPVLDTSITTLRTPTLLYCYDQPDPIACLISTEYKDGITEKHVDLAYLTNQGESERRHVGHFYTSLTSAMGFGILYTATGYPRDTYHPHGHSRRTTFQKGVLDV